MVDEQNPRNGYRVVEWFRFVTPVLVTIAITMVGGLRGDIKDIGNKLFIHLTNEEMHMPRGRISSKAEFELYREFTDKKIDALVNSIEKMESKILAELRSK